MADLIDSYSESNQDQASDLGDTANHAYGQALHLYNNYSISSIKFYIARVDVPVGNITAKIYAATGTVGTNATPTGSVLGTSGNIDATTISTSASLVEFTFSPAINLIPGDYCFECYFSGGNYVGTQYVAISSDGSSPTHAGNAYNRNSSETASSQNADACFYLYGTITSGGGFLLNFI